MKNPLICERCGRSEEDVDIEDFGGELLCAECKKYVIECNKINAGIRK